jgi:protein TonB
MRIIQRANKEVFEYVEQMPEFEGGEDALTNYLANNIQYPKAEKAKKIEGKVVVGFIIEPSGEISNIKAIKYPTNGQALADEAIRVVKNMPKWKAGKENGKLVKVAYSLPIMFKLN